MSQNYKNEYPFFDHHPHTIYLDNAATTQKPKDVIESITYAYSAQYASVHRGSYALQNQTTHLFEESRKSFAKYIHASSPRECIFTKNATDGLNLIANTFSEAFLQEGDEIILSEMEHHSNLVPWMQVAQKKKAKIQYIPINTDGSLNIDTLENIITEKTKILSITHVSNVLGTQNDIKLITHLAKKHGIKVVIDGCQAFAHYSINVQDINCDAYVVSAHKAYGPSGLGIAYIARETLEQLPPYQGGGNMVASADFTSFTPKSYPHTFETGTLQIPEILALKDCIEHLEVLQQENTLQRLESLADYTRIKLKELPGIHIHSHPHSKTLVSFFIEGENSHDIGDMLGERNICVRTGMHCAHPLFSKLHINSLIRVSFAAYNSEKDIDALLDALREIIDQSE